MRVSLAKGRNVPFQIHVVSRDHKSHSVEEFLWSRLSSTYLQSLTYKTPSKGNVRWKTPTYPVSGIQFNQGLAESIFPVC